MAEPKPVFHRVVAENRKARHDYEILDTVEAGLVLRGTEVKAAREGKVQLKDAYVELRKGEAWLVGVHIGAYSHGNRENHEPERPRKLLLSRRDLDKLLGRTVGKGFTVVPLSVYLKGRWIKSQIALVRGKKLHDKRATERERAAEKETREALKTLRG